MAEHVPSTPNQRTKASRVVIGALFFFILGVIAGWALHAAIAPGEDPAAGPAGAGPLDGQIAALQGQIAEAEAGLGTRGDEIAARVHLANNYFDLGTALASRGDSAQASTAFAQAIVHYEAARAAGTASADVLTDLGTMYFRVGKPAEAVGAYLQAIASDSAHANAWMNLGVVRKEAFGDTAAARQAWERVIQLSPSAPEAARVKGWLQMMGQAR